MPAVSVAVLPFVNIGPDAGDESFVDGLTEELINELGRVSGLRVIARTSSFQYRGQAGDLRRIAADLNVAYVVEGSVRSAGHHIRVTAQLTDVDQCAIRWSAKYERDLTDVLEVQDDICDDAHTTDFIASFLPRRAATIQYVRETTDALHDHAAPLGAFGDLDAYQWLLLLATHTERHIQQIEDVKEAVKSSA
jgi:TolB-like protein